MSGQRLGAYTVSTLLGVGGMGEVYRAYDPRLAREVAIKVLPQEFSRDPARQARLYREARAVAQLGHPNIVTIYDIGDDGDGPTYLVYELVAGRTLRHLLAEGALPVESVVHFAQDVASGLAAAHKRGIVHRDVEPENLLVSENVGALRSTCR